MPENRDLPDRREWLDCANRSPDDFEDGDQLPMTDEQAHRLKALCWRLGLPFDASLGRDDAERRIQELARRE